MYLFKGVTVYDHIPTGFILASPDPYGWTIVSADTVSLVFSDRLERDSCMTILIDLEVLPSVRR